MHLLFNIPREKIKHRTEVIFGDFVFSKFGNMKQIFTFRLIFPQTVEDRTGKLGKQGTEVDIEKTEKCHLPMAHLFAGLSKLAVLWLLFSQTLTPV